MIQIKHNKSQLVGGWPVGYLHSVEKLNSGPPKTNPFYCFQSRCRENGTRNTLIKKGRRKKLNRNGQKESVCWKRLIRDWWSQKKKRIDAEIKSLDDTADELCTKAEVTAKIAFVTQENAFKWSANDKLNDLVSLDKKLSSMLEKLKEWFYTIIILWLYDIICTYRNCFFGVTVEKMWYQA